METWQLVRVAIGKQHDSLSNKKKVLPRPSLQNCELDFFGASTCLENQVRLFPCTYSVRKWVILFLIGQSTNAEKFMVIDQLVLEIFVPQVQKSVRKLDLRKNSVKVSISRKTE